MYTGDSAATTPGTSKKHTAGTDMGTKTIKQQQNTETTQQHSSDNGKPRRTAEDFLGEEF